jgi:leader peptidase (prepilin peptidase) / N-methyltransferase
MLVIFIALFGLFIGSFLNVLIDRLPREENPFVGRSHCDYCNHKLAWFDLVPLVSFLMLQGKCRYCKKFIGWKYPLIETTTALLFVTTFIFLPYRLLPYPIGSVQYLFSELYYLFIVSSLLVIFFCDLFYGIIPDAIIIPASVGSFLYIVFTSFFSLPYFLLSGLGAFFFFFLLFAITKGKGMGFGDVKFAFLMGLILGWPNIFFSIYIAFLTGAIVASILIVWKKKKFFGTTIPFGPFLVFGTLFSLFYGSFFIQKIIPFYF